MYAPERGAALHDGNLGIPVPWGMIAGVGVDVARSRFGAAKDWVRRYKSNFTGVCPGTPPEADIVRGVEVAPADLIDSLTRALKAGNSGVGPSTKAELADPATAKYWIHAAMGGGDCVNKSQPAAPSYLFTLASMGARGTFPTSAPTSGGGSGGSSPTTGTPQGIGDVYMPHPPLLLPPEATFSPPPPGPVPVPEVPQDLVPFSSGFLEDLKRIASSAGKEAASRVAEEAIERIPEKDRARAVEYAAPYVEPYVVDHYRGRMAGGIQEHLPLIAGGAVALLLLPQLLGGGRRRR